MVADATISYGDGATRADRAATPDRAREDREIRSRCTHQVWLEGLISEVARFYGTRPNWNGMTLSDVMCMTRFQKRGKLRPGGRHREQSTSSRQEQSDRRATARRCCLDDLAIKSIIGV